MKAEHGNTFVEFAFGKTSYTCYVEIQFHRRLSIPNVKTGEASAGRVTQNTSQIVEGRQRSVSPSGPVVTLLSRGDTLCHRLTRTCDTLVVRTDAITLHASWDWDLIYLTKPASGASMTQDSCWIQVKWLAHGSHITGGDQDVDSVNLETSSSTTDSVQERTFESGSALSQKALFVQKGGHMLVIH